MAARPQAPHGSGFRKLLSGKDKNDVLSLITKRHAVGKRIPARDPDDVNTQGFIDPRSRDIKRFVAESFNHALQLWLAMLTS
jgi:hypothetical protein